MKTFEYIVDIPKLSRNYRDEDSWLEQRGLEGWELVSVVKEKHSLGEYDYRREEKVNVFYFKREIKSDE